MEVKKDPKKFWVEKINKANEEIPQAKGQAIYSAIVAVIGAGGMADTLFNMTSEIPVNFTNIGSIFLFGGCWLWGANNCCKKIDEISEMKKTNESLKMELIQAKVEEENPTIEKCEENKKHIVTKIIKADQINSEYVEQIDEVRQSGALFYAIAVLLLLTIKDTSLVIKILATIGLCISSIFTYSTLKFLNVLKKEQKEYLNEKTSLETEVEIIENISRKRRLENR